MKRIKQLDAHVAELIAAGEVVERPASAVKELVENSIDAGATAITVEIRGGGIQLIRVKDDGMGIPKEDARLAFSRNATSKVEKAEDLAKIGTLGFRGEALASIAAVSRVEMVTCLRKEEEGIRIQLSGGQVEGEEEMPAPAGTTITVRDLFYNTPARMKFLKKDQTEGNAVSACMDRMALSHPEISFKYIRDGKTVLFTAGDGALLTAIYAVFGKEFAEGLIPAKSQVGDFLVEGFVSKTECSRGSRSMQYFFINGRYVKTGVGQSALEEAYKNEVMVHKFPACVLFLSMPVHLVDVNTHPSKIEVRFTEERPVYEAIYYAAKNALQTQDQPPELHLRERPEHILQKNEAMKAEGKQMSLHPGWKTPLRPQTDFWKKEDASAFRKGESKGPLMVQQEQAAYQRQGYFDKEPVETPLKGNQRPDFSKKGETQEALKAKEEEISAPSTSIYEDAVYVGEAFSTYVLFEQGDTLYFMDKHAAHERLLFESLRLGEGAGSQVLLDPLAVTLPKDEYELVLEHSVELSEMGIMVDDFGQGTVLIREFPADLAGGDCKAILEEIAANLRAGKRDFSPKLRDEIYHSIACKAAIKGRAQNSQKELLELLRLLHENGEIQHCPHGRPVVIALGKREVEKRFGRVH